ncbi:S41 family peptidase [Sphingomonas sp. SUN039]|uniref:S41 family peptidase n=1 Tax=Sphingomonas sp. SUN039 TaxID=2937787 RepID=UPI00216405B9|nr:S41 family peptidase [Sphingomonas sp. SUN039]UVO53135.1 S41 family peptidase [Sphingomonas sp. SUN039]
MTTTLTRRHLLAVGGAAMLTPASILRAAPSTGELRTDIDIVRRTLALHPGLYRYQTPRQIEDRLKVLERDYAASGSLDRQFLALSAFMAEIRCGHSQCNPYNQKKAVVQALFERPTKLPFEFDWIDRRMVVLADRSGQGLARGTEILLIEGEATSRLLAGLLPYARADGSNDAKRVVQMAMRNTDRFETFDIYQGIIRPPANGVYRIGYRTPDGRTGAAEVAALTPEARRTTRHTLETGGGTSVPFWTWEMKDDVAVLTMPSWVMYNSRWDWESWLNDRLSALKGAKGLILDLRDNEGGNECGNAILARLSDRDLRFKGYRQLVRYRRTPKELDPYLDTWDESFRTIGEKGRDVGNGFYELGIEESDTIPVVGPRLILPVAALVGPVCSSATFSFARRARESGLVRLFGEQSGGNLRGINGNGYFFVRLPASGLEFDMPIIGNFAQVPQADRGVLPDVAVKPTIADIAAGRDPCMTAARRWIVSHPR